jgi:Ion channel
VTDPDSIAAVPAQPAQPALASHRERYGLLLGAIIVAFAIEGIAEPGRFEEIFVSVLLGATLLLALWAADTKPRVMWPAVLIVAVLILTSIVEALNGNVGGGATRIANALLVALAPPAIIVGVVRSLRARQAVTLEAVFGVLCVYILLGMFFAAVYGTIDRFGGDPFFAGGQAATLSNCLYFSFTSLTTVGFGDLTARSNLGHTLSVFEALLGQIYLVTVVSLIVANLGRSRPAAKAE